MHDRKGLSSRCPARRPLLKGGILMRSDPFHNRHQWPLTRSSISQEAPNLTVQRDDSKVSELVRGPARRRADDGRLLICGLHPAADPNRPLGQLHGLLPPQPAGDTQRTRSSSFRLLGATRVSARAFQRWVVWPLRLKSLRGCFSDGSGLSPGLRPPFGARHAPPPQAPFPGPNVIETPLPRTRRCHFSRLAMSLPSGTPSFGKVFPVYVL